MLLTLQTTRYRGLPVAQPLSIVVDEHGATIGRNPGNDLVLPDPDRFVSGQHAVIRFQDGAFYLSDTSTNGTFLNHAGSPIGRATPVRLNNGDELTIGEYELQVTVAAEAPLGRPAAAGSEIGLEGEAAPDPLALLGGAQQGARLTSPEYGIPGPPPPAPRPTPAERPGEPAGGHMVIPEDFDLLAPKPQEPGMGRAGSEPDHVPAEQQEFLPPQAIPEDWDLTGAPAPPPPAEPHPEAPEGAERPAEEPWEPPPEPAPPPPAAEAAPAAPPAQPTPEPPSAMPWEPPPAPAAPPEDIWAPAAPPPEPEAPPAPPLRPAPARPAPAPPPAAAPPAGAEADALAAFISGLGLEPVQLRPEVIPAVMVTFGRIVREMTDGLIKVLSARSQFKHELRLEMTTVRPVENNPLKFSVDVDEALHHLLLPRAKGYLPPLEAVHEAFDDIQAHQLAIMAGLHAALAAMLGRFDPKRLEEGFKERSVLDNLLPIARKAKYWDIFNEIYQDIAKDAAEGFLQLFSEEFTRAYEEQVHKLKAAGSRQRH